MRSNKQVFRWLTTRLPTAKSRRIVILTGARQTGKTTLAKRLFPDLRYLNLDDLEQRELARAIRSANWGREIGAAVVDEAQKEPAVFDKVKLAFDEGGVSFSVLLGSSRVLLLKQVRESLAGRAFVYELWPLLASELRNVEGSRPRLPLFDRLISEPANLREILGDEPQRLLAQASARRSAAVDHLAAWGGMPELLRLDDNDRREWLRSYQLTFLERDLADLTRVSDLLPFRTLQRLAMLRTGQLLNYSELGRDAALSAQTARRYLEHLRLSYQVELLPPYSRNLTSATVKTPKLHWMDMGLLRQGTGMWGPLTGPMFETLVVSEARKWIDTLARDASLWFYRTRSGHEVDLLVTVPEGVIGIEIKNRERVERRDGAGLLRLAQVLNEEWLGGLVVHRGEDLLPLDSRLWGVPVHRLF